MLCCCGGVILAKVRKGNVVTLFAFLHSILYIRVPIVKKQGMISVGHVGTRFPENDLNSQDIHTGLPYLTFKL
jgi:hypothetical protein